MLGKFIPSCEQGMEVMTDSFINMPQVWIPAGWVGILREPAWDRPGTCRGGGGEGEGGGLSHRPGSSVCFPSLYLTCAQVPWFTPEDGQLTSFFVC